MKIRMSLNQYISIGVVVLVGFSLSVLLFISTRNNELQKIQANFNIDSLDRINSVKKEIDLSFEVLKSVLALYQSSELVTRDEFRKFVTLSFLRHKDIAALKWIPVVPHHKRKDYEHAARTDGCSGFQIIEFNEKGAIVEAKTRKEYLPVYYIEPYKKNQSVLGLDLASDETLLEALNKAQDTGEIVVSAQTRLSQVSMEKDCFIVFLSVYRDQANLNTVESRRRNLSGFIGAKILLKELYKEGLDSLSIGGIDISIFDDSASPDESLLHTHLSRLRNKLYLQLRQEPEMKQN